MHVRDNNTILLEQAPYAMEFPDGGTQAAVKLVSDDV
jgi:hypothetical protein